MVDGDRIRALVVQVADELGEELAVAFEFGAQGAADPQVLLKPTVKINRAEIDHAAPPGHGRASVRNVSRSTFNGTVGY